MHILKRSAFVLLLGAAPALTPTLAGAQDILPADNGLEDYHTAPNYRESESHPLRVLAYIVHPIGWVARELVFRPLSYFASSSEVTRSVMGYRYPFDYRTPECFSADDSAPDCRSVMPFNYVQGASSAAPAEASENVVPAPAQIYFPNVNFDFNKRKLNALGKGRTRQIADMLKQDVAVKVVLEGHTDYIGSDGYNQKLGMDRAEAVRSELVSQGIASDRLATVTFGESRPVINEQTDHARAVNRRVEVHIDDQGGAAGAAGEGAAAEAPATAEAGADAAAPAAEEGSGHGVEVH